MLAVCVIGIVNDLEYWMKARMSPIDMRAVGYLEAADDPDRDVVEVAHEVHRGLDDPGDELGPEAGLEDGLVLLVEDPDRVLGVAEGLDDRMAGVRLLDVGVEMARGRPLAGELLLRLLRDQHRQAERGRNHDQGYDGQDRADPDHHRQDADDGDDRGDDLRQALLERVGDVVDVVGREAQRLATLVRIEVLERQPAELLVHVLAKAVDRSLRDLAHGGPGHPREEGGEQVQAREGQQDVTERGEVDADAGREVVRLQHRRLLWRVLLGQGDRLVVGQVRRELLAEQPGEELIHGDGHDLGPEDLTGRAEERDHGHEADPLALGPQDAHEPAEGLAEVLGLFDGHHHAVAHRPAHRSAAPPAGAECAAGPAGPAGSTGLRLEAGRRKLGPAVAVAVGAVAVRAVRWAAHATSSRLSWE